MITWLNNFHKDVNNFLSFVKDGPSNPENTEGNTGIRIMLWLVTGFLLVLLLICGICTFSLYRKKGALLPDVVGMIYYTGNLFFVFVFALGMTLPVFKNKKMNECKVAIMRICIYLSIVYTSVFLILVYNTLHGTEKKQIRSYKQKCGRTCCQCTSLYWRICDMS